jgi:spore germination cell wall hydrolase CwlJ-like protein
MRLTNLFLMPLLCTMALPAAAKTYAAVEPAHDAADDLRRLPADTIIPAIRQEGVIKRDQILCLALAMYHEARGESENERLAVAQVIYNRALHANASVCSTVWADNGSQFQWVRSSGTIVPREISAWEAVQSSAVRFAHHRPSDITHGATNFFNPELCSPDWAKAGRVTVSMRQVFLRLDGTSGRFAGTAPGGDPISRLDRFGRILPTRVYPEVRS